MQAKAYSHCCMLCSVVLVNHFALEIRLENSKLSNAEHSIKTTCDMAYLKTFVRFFFENL